MEVYLVPVQYALDDSALLEMEDGNDG